MARAKNALLWAFEAMAPAMGKIWSIFAKIAILPIYKVFMTIRMRLNRVMLSARGFLFIAVTNRYILHIVILGVSILTIGSQLQTKNATALEAGQNSLLYTLVTGGQESFIEEEVRPELFVKDTHYLGANTLETEYGIDFDYTPIEEADLNDWSLPGTIAYTQGADEPGMLTTPAAPTRAKTEFYTVAEGDTISTIAARFSVNVATVLWANNLTQRTTLRIGQSLKIPPVSGVLHTVKKNDTLAQIAKTYGSSVEQIQVTNKLAPNTVLSLGEEIVIPGGTPPVLRAPVAVRSTVKPEAPIARIGNKAVDIYQELTGTADTREKPADAADTKTATKLFWPTDSHNINQYFGWRHTGLDIHGRYNNAIYAADEGTVEVAGWNSGGYGLQIVVNHGGNMKTRYAHASKLFVKPGDKVKRGQVMAMVGTTGRSTGPHLHFEVIVSGKVKNPLAYTR